MVMINYLLSLVTGNLLWIFIILIVSLFFQPARTLWLIFGKRLFQDNRPGYGHPHQKHYGDRMLEIYSKFLKGQTVKYGESNFSNPNTGFVFFNQLHPCSRADDFLLESRLVLKSQSNFVIPNTKLKFDLSLSTKIGNCLVYEAFLFISQHIYRDSSGVFDVNIKGRYKITLVYLCIIFVLLLVLGVSLISN